MMKYFLYANTFVAVLAFLNSILVSTSAKRKYRYKHKMSYLERIIRLVAFSMFCCLPIINIGLVFIKKEAYIESLKNDDDYELIE